MSNMNENGSRPEAQPSPDPMRTAKRDFNMLGLAFFVMTAVQYLLSNGLAYIGNRYFPDFAATEWFYWLSGSGVLYIFAMPAAALIMRAIPRRLAPATGEATEKPRRMSGYEFFCAVVICIGLMEVGNLVGNTVNSFFAIFTGRSSLSGLDNIMFSSNPIVMFAVVVILGPMLEELLFRKLIIDRISKYGASAAMLTSALIFGLCHGNLQQFFYAFAVGLFFAFIYLRTGSLRLTALLHMVVNFIGGFVPSMLMRWLLNGDGYQRLLEMTNELQLAGSTAQLPTEQLIEYMKTFMPLITPMMLILAWSFSLIGVAFVGMYLFFSERRKFTLSPCPPAETVIPKERRGEVIFLNVGMILYAAAMALIIALSFFIRG